MKDYVKRIRNMREEREWSLQQTADYLDVSQDEYAQYELGTANIPTKILIQLSELYGVSIDYLLCITDKPERLY